MKDRATELEYLTWFRINADFGPADSDVKLYLDQRFMEETGMHPLQCGNVATYQIEDQWYCKKHAAAIALELLAVPVESL
jgi:hypothetical protein